jgi:zinc D-Ala-D-Ala carboxypeptidase
MDWTKIKYFSKSELACPCGRENCKELPMNEEFMLALDALREEYGHPIHLSSGYRCPKHNMEVGGVLGSYHTLGVAVDIAIYGKPAYDLLGHIFDMGFEGIGINQTGPYNQRFIHIDKGFLANAQTKKRPAVFTY